VTLGLAADASAEIAKEFDKWVGSWVLTTQRWRWDATRELNYFDDFEGPPTDIATSGKRLSFRLDGRPGAKWWRDWLALRLLPEAQTRFPAILGIEQVVDED
jgi:hypothetical protein